MHGAMVAVMKSLVAITCIAVLGALGYFFWGEFQQFLVQQDAKNAAALQREAAARFAVEKSECFEEYKGHIQAKTGSDLLPLPRRQECEVYFTDDERAAWRAAIRY
jgi:type II secretory pathway pseudopilin PulG